MAARRPPVRAFLRMRYVKYGDEKIQQFFTEFDDLADRIPQLKSNEPMKLRYLRLAMTPAMMERIRGYSAAVQQKYSQLRDRLISDVVTQITSEAREQLRIRFYEIGLKTGQTAVKFAGNFRRSYRKAYPSEAERTDEIVIEKLRRQLPEQIVTIMPNVVAKSWRDYLRYLAEAEAKCLAEKSVAEKRERRDTRRKFSGQKGASDSKTVDAVDNEKVGFGVKLPSHEIAPLREKLHLYDETFPKPAPSCKEGSSYNLRFKRDLPKIS